MVLVVPAFYSCQQGSLRYCAWPLAIFSAIVLWQQRRPGPHRLFMPYVVAVLMIIEAFMTLLLGFVASPFEALPRPPADGVGLNPLLYDEGMRIHPPMLLAGLMSWSVPFAFAVAALATGKLGNEWVALSRRYAMVAWVILGLGNVLGAWWAYHVLGWGGYWGWDPVENVALMPWLATTAYLHSSQVQERRGRLRLWNFGLVIVAFLLVVFGTFIVRSGVVPSVHTFAISAIGPWFLGFLFVCVVFSALLLTFRSNLGAGRAPAPAVSREGAFVLQNLLLLGLVAVVMWGTVLPLVSGMLGAQRVAGAPFYERAAGPLLAVILALLAAGPLLPWPPAGRPTLSAF